MTEIRSDGPESTTDIRVRRYASSLGIYVQGEISLEGPLSRLLLRIGDEVHLARVGIPSPFEPQHTPVSGYPATGFRYFADLASDGGSHLDLELIGIDFDSRERCLFRGQLLFPEGGQVPRPPTSAVDRASGSGVAVVRHRLGVGGAQWWVDEVSAALIKTAPSPRVVDGSAAVLGLDNYAEGGLRRFRSDADYEDCVNRSILALQELRPAVVLVNTIEGLPAVDAALSLGIAVVWAIHESYGLGALWASAFGLEQPAEAAAVALERCLRGVDVQIFSCDETAELFERFRPRRARRVIPYVRPIHLTADARAEARREIRRASGIGDEDVVFVSVATIEERKNQIPLTGSFATAFDGQPGPALLLAGPGDPRYMNTLHDVIAHARLAEAVTVINEAVDAERYLASGDVYVSASDIESRPVVLTQAAQLGMPIVASSAMGVRDVVRDERNGLVVPCGDYSRFRECLQRMNADSGLRRSLSAGARAMAGAQDVDWAADVAATVVELLDG